MLSVNYIQDSRCLQFHPCQSLFHVTICRSPDNIGSRESKGHNETVKHKGVILGIPITGALWDEPEYQKTLSVRYSCDTVFEKLLFHYCSCIKPALTPLHMFWLPKPSY